MFTTLEYDKASQPVSNNKVNVLIADVSGSMYYHMNSLSQETKSRVDRIPKGQTVIIGIFSSNGLFQWICNRCLNTEEDYNFVKQKISQEFYTRGATCFSEILMDTTKVLSPFKDFDSITLTFMSDGYPVVPNISVEEQNIEKALDSLSSLITSGAVIAFGNYADTNRLSKIATRLGIPLEQVRDTAEIGNIFENVSKRPSTKKVRLKVPANSKLAYTIDEENNVEVLPIKEGEVSFNSGLDVKVVQNGDFKIDYSNETNYYQAALAYVQSQRYEEAVDILSKVGDVYLTNLANNMVTNTDVAAVSDSLKSAIKNKNGRFLLGRQPDCKPKDDAFDMLDLITLLCKGDNYLNIERFKYNKIGRPSKVKGEYPRFISVDDWASFGKLVTNSKELNLGVSMVVKGYINLPDKVELDGKELTKPSSFGDTFNTKIFRTFALVSDGFANVQELPVKLDENTFLELKKHKMVEGDYSPVEIYTLNITKIPTCNKKKGFQSSNIYEMAELALSSKTLEAKIKAVKNFLNQEDEEDPKVVENLTEEETNFLLGCGLNLNLVYSPPTEQSESTDQLDVKSFEIKIAKSTLPKVDAVIKKDLENKTLSFFEAQMLESYKKSNTSPKEECESVLENLKNSKKEKDLDLAIKKIAFALTGQWKKLTSEEEYKLSHSDQDFTFSLKTITKKI